MSTETVGGGSSPSAASPYRFLATLFVIGGFAVLVGAFLLEYFTVPLTHIGVGLGFIVLGMSMNLYMGSPPQLND